MGSYGHFSPLAPSQSGIVKQTAIAVPYSRWWLLSVYGYSWQPTHVCHYELCIGSTECSSWPYLISSAPTLYCMEPATPAHCSGAYEIHTTVNPSAFTSRAHPCGVVSNMAPDRLAQRVGAFWLLLPRLCWEDPIQLGMIGNNNTFIRDMWGERECGY